MASKELLGCGPVWTLRTWAPIQQAVESPSAHAGSTRRLHSTELVPEFRGADVGGQQRRAPGAWVSEVSWLGTQSRLSLTTLPQACCVALLRLICKRGGNNACSVSEVGFCDKQVMLPSR